jgi:hypothetical protein
MDMDTFWKDKDRFRMRSGQVLFGYSVSGQILFKYNIGYIHDSMGWVKKWKLKTFEQGNL